MENAVLIVKRFCGDEFYPLEHANWYFIGNTLWIDMAFKQGTQLHEDTEFLEQEPTWEVSFKVDSEEMLQKGMIVENSNENDEDAIFYYCEHNPTYKNRLEILDREDNKLHIKISGECCDINYYDGSKGNDYLEITAWIDKRA